MTNMVPMGEGSTRLEFEILVQSGAISLRQMQYQYLEV
jgi:hypothetical protein